MFRLSYSLFAIFFISFLQLQPAIASDQAAQIELLVDQRLEAYLKSEEFDKRVEGSINRYVAKQANQRAKREQEALKKIAANLAPVNPESDHIRGDTNAQFSLIEYSDYECPFCKRFHSTAIEFTNKHPEVKWVYRHFPLDFHNPGAQTEAEAAECAGYLGGTKVFWAYSDAIYARTKSNGKGFPISNLTPLAVELGIEKNAFEQCLADRRFQEKVESDYKNGVASGVSGTPGNFLVNHASGRIIPVSGAQPLEKLEQVLEQLKQVQ